MVTVLDQSILAQVRQALSGLEQPVEMLFFGSQAECETCETTRRLLEELAAAHEALSLSVYDLEADQELAAHYQVDKAPGVVIAARHGDELRDYGIRFSGIPAGHEFSTLINDILLVSRGDSGLSAGTRLYLQALQEPLLLQVFVTPTCPYCPRAVLLAHQMAMENPRMIRAEGVQATEFRELAEKYYVSGVPQTVINSGAKMVVGAVPELNLLGQIRAALQN